MWKRVSRILRAEVEHARQAIADRIRRPRSGERYETPSGERSTAARDEGATMPGDEVRKAFAALELPLTATADEVRKAWRALMARYHPDHHATDPEREALATELARRLTEARDRALAWITSKR
jgi:DnaJ-domain-containing protein 1